jgi:preprotein translocase subunit SecG
MLIAFLTVLFVIVCLLLILLILVQRGKSSMGLGSMGGSAQMLFGGSGGQDIFQKATWVLGAIFMFGSLGLALLTTKSHQTSRYINATQKELPALPENNN